MSARGRRLPLRARLVAAFAGVMLLVLTGAGAFVYWRVEVALDHTLDADLSSQAQGVARAWRLDQDPAAVVSSRPVDTIAQLLSYDGQVVAATPAASGLVLITPGALALRGQVRTTGNLLTGGRRRLRVRTVLLLPDQAARPLVAAVAVRLGPRDEALRELLGQLAAANLIALLAASLVAYRLALAALRPVERYRTRAEQIADGVPGVRLDVPQGVDDEVTRLGHTLNRMLTVQERTVEQQRQFLADASHELRAPLAVLTSEVELALRRPRTAEQHERTLQQVALDTARLVQLADQLLDLEQGRASGAQTADVGQLLDRLAYPGTVASPGLLSVRVGLAPSQLQQVLDNLVRNAQLHGQGAVRADARPAGDGVLLTVSDEGDGPPADFLPHAVERFRRADPARTTPGSGLGLALVHTLVGQAGGELRLCTPAGHHRFPPHVAAAPACRHEGRGTHASAWLPAL